MWLLNRLGLEVVLTLLKATEAWVIILNLSTTHFRLPVCLIEYRIVAGT